MELVRPAPVRRRICLGCRTLLADGQTCGARRHVAVALDDPAQRARLDDEVWGPDSRARALRRAAKAGASGGALGGILEGCNGCDAAAQGLEGCGELAGAGEGVLAVLAAILTAIAFAVVTAVVVWLVLAVVKAIRARLDRPKPHGALRKAPKASGRSHGAGTIGDRAGATRVRLPWKKGEALAYALELHTKAPFGGGALLRDAMTAGFDVSLDDGRHVRIPAGPVRIVGKLAQETIDRKQLDTFLADVDPRSEERSLFPYDFAKGLVVEAGARVDVLGELEIRADGAEGHGYRASAGMLVPVGIPVLRVRERTDDDRRVRIAPADGEAGADADAAAEAEAEAEAGAELDAPATRPLGSALRERR